MVHVYNDVVRAGIEASTYVFQKSNDVIASCQRGGLYSACAREPPGYEYHAV